MTAIPGLLAFMAEWTPRIPATHLRIFPAALGNLLAAATAGERARGNRAVALLKRALTQGYYCGQPGFSSALVADIEAFLKLADYEEKKV